MHLDPEKKIEEANEIIKPISNYRGLFSPNYERNITQCLPTALKSLGLDFNIDRTLMNDSRIRSKIQEILHSNIENIIFIVIDSLGFHDFLKYINILKNKGFYFPLSSVFPTITSTAITSIHTGCYPEEHGILGYKILFDEFGTIIDTLKLSTDKAQYRDSLQKVGIDINKLFWKKSLHKHNKKENILDISLYNYNIANTGLSTFINEPQNIIPFGNNIDGFSTIAKILNQNQNSPKLIHIYLEMIDLLYHKYGPYSEPAKLAFEFYEKILKLLKKQIESKIIKKTAILMVSDHGQQSIKPDYLIKFSKEEIEDFSKLIRSKPGKSGRTLHFYAKKDNTEKLFEKISEKIGDKGFTFTFKDLSRIIKFKTRNLIKIKKRLGDIIVILKDNYTASYRIDEENENIINTPLLGQHGGLSFEELCSFCGLINLEDI